MTIILITTMLIISSFVMIKGGGNKYAHVVVERQQEVETRQHRDGANQSSFPRTIVQKQILQQKKPKSQQTPRLQMVLKSDFPSKNSDSVPHNEVIVLSTTGQRVYRNGLVKNEL